MYTNHNSLIQITPSLKAAPIDTDALAWADNPQPRCPVVLLLDCSQSMEGEPLRQLNEGLRRFQDELLEDPVAVQSVELAIVTFGATVEIRQRFGPLSDRPPLPELSATGRTPMGAALRLALAEIHERREFYRRHGLSAYKPWLVLLTDGQPNDDWHEPATKALTMVRAGRLSIIGVGIGSHVDMATLSAICGEAPGPLRLADLRFRDFFRWLSDSLRFVTGASAHAERIIPFPSGDDWLI